jgi:hypothetical protein
VPVYRAVIGPAELVGPFPVGRKLGLEEVSNVHSEMLFFLREVKVH